MSYKRQNLKPKILSLMEGHVMKNQREPTMRTKNTVLYKRKSNYTVEFSRLNTWQQKRLKFQSYLKKT